MKKVLTISGIPEIQKFLSQIEQSQSKKVIRKVLREEAKEIQKIAKDKLPEGETKELKRLTKIQAVKRSTVSIGINIINNSEHSSFTEYGTQFQEPQGVFRAIYDANTERSRKQVIKKIESALQAEINKGDG